MTHEDRERWAEDHGYSHGTCRIHRGFWSDCGLSCPRCDEIEERREDAEETEEEE